MSRYVSGKSIFFQTSSVKLKYTRPTDYMHASRVNYVQDRIDTNLVKAGYTYNGRPCYLWTIYNPTSSFSAVISRISCCLEGNFVTYCLKKCQFSDTKYIR